MKTSFKRLITLTTISTIPLLAAPLILAWGQTQEQVGGQKNPYQPWNPSLDPKLSFQANIDQLIKEQKLMIRWQNEIQPPLDLIKMVVSDDYELTKGFEFWAWRPDLEKWTNDLGWSWQINNVDLKDQFLIINWEIIETDENGYATGQIATYQQQWHLDEQSLTISQYQEQILTYQLKDWKTSRDYRQISSKQWIDLMVNQNWFFANVMQPLRVLGKTIKAQINQQVVENQLTITADQQVKTWKFDDNQQTILFIDDQKLLTNRDNYDLLVINDGTKKQLNLNDNWDGQYFNQLNLEGWNDVKIGSNFVFRAKQIKFALQSHLVLPDRFTYDPGLISAILPQADLATTTKWLQVFQIKSLQSGAYVEQVWQSLKNQWFDQSAKTLNWSQFLGPDQYQINWIQFLTTVVLNQDWNRVILNATNPQVYWLDWTNGWNQSTQMYSKWIAKLAAVEEVVIPEDQEIAKLDLTKLMQIFPHATIRIGQNVQRVVAPIFDAKGVIFKGKIIRKINPEVIKKFVQGQTLFVNSDQNWNLNELLNSFDLEQNQQLYGKITKVVWDQFHLIIDDYNYNITYLSATILKNLAFLTHLPSWQMTKVWKEDNPLIVPLSANQVHQGQMIDVQLKAAPGVISSFIQSANNEWAIAPEQVKWLKQYGITYRFVGNKKTHLIDDQGVLDYKKYLEELNNHPDDENNYLVDQGDYIKQIKLAPDQSIISQRSLMGINFQTEVQLDLQQIETIEANAFSATTNLKLINSEQVKTVAKAAFSGIGSGLTIDLTKVQWNTISDDLFRATAMQLVGRQISSTIKTIGKGAFLASDLDYQDQQKPLDLTGINAIGFNAFSYNENLFYVQTGVNYRVFDGFEYSGLKGFDFQFIERIDFGWTPDHTFSYDQITRFALPNFSQSELNLQNLWTWNDPNDDARTNLLDFNLPSVKKLIWNQHITSVKTFSIKGLTNLEQLINYQGDINPNQFFQSLKQPLKWSYGHPLEPQDFGYNVQTNVIDWSDLDLLVGDDFWTEYDVSQQSEKLGTLVVTRWNQLISYFQQKQIGVVEKMVLPKIFFGPNLRFNQIWSAAIKPLFKIKTLASSNLIAKGTFDPRNIAFQVFQPFIIDQIAPDFLLNLDFSPSSGGELANWNLQKQTNAVILPAQTDWISGFTFKNSGIKAFKWDHPDNINTNWQRLQIGPNSFDAGVKINLDKRTRIAINTFAANEDWSGVELDGKPVWTWLKQFYQPQLKVLDLTQAQNDDAKWLVVIFQNTALKKVVLPQLRSLNTDWFKIGKSVDEVVISEKTTIIGEDVSQIRTNWKQNLSPIKTIINHSVSVDHLGIIKN